MPIILNNISKNYQELAVLNNLSYTFEDNKIYCIMAPSGSGKTTMFRIMLGLEDADSGSISGISPGRIAAVFQEDRLCEPFSALENTMLAVPKNNPKHQVQQLLLELLPKEALTKPVSQLSGGMRRRVAIARALVHPSQVLIFDEPFAGLDEETKQQVQRCILKHRGQRTLIVSTHNESDVLAFNATKVNLDAIQSK